MASRGARAGRRTASHATSRPDEVRGLTYTSEALREPISILGVPEVELWLWTSMPVATCVVRLSDVAPDGTSSLVATGALNLTHRRSDTHPTPMPADRRTAELVRIPLRTSGYRFAVDHQIRLTVLGGYWPVLWPSPFPGTMRVFRGFVHPSRLLLPELPDDAPLPAPPAFGPATRGRTARGGLVRRPTSPAGGSRRTCWREP